MMKIDDLPADRRYSLDRLIPMIQQTEIMFPLVKKDLIDGLKYHADERELLAEKVKQYESFFNVERLKQIKVDEKKLETIRVLNDALYEDLPSGKIDGLELIKLIGSHYEAVAEVLMS